MSGSKPNHKIISYCIQLLSFFACNGFVNAQIISDPLVINQTHESATITEVIITDSATMINVLINPKLFPVKALCPGNKISLGEAFYDFKRTSQQKTTDTGNTRNDFFPLLRINNSLSCKAGEEIPSDMQEVYIQLVFDKMPSPHPILLDLTAKEFKFEGICLKDKMALEISLYQRAFEQYENQNTDSALVLFKNVIELRDTIHIMYPNALFNTAVLLESKGDKKKAILAYKTVLQAKINDAELMEQDNSKPCNFNHQSCLRIGLIQKKLGKYEEALKYYWMADTAFSFIDIDILNIKKNKLFLLTEKIECLDSLKRYKEAVNLGLQVLINQEIFGSNNKLNFMVIDIIKQHLDYKKLVNEFDKSLKNIQLTEKGDNLVGKFNFNEKEFFIELPKSLLSNDLENQNQSSENPKKKNDYQTIFINSIKNSDFYRQLKTKN